jgi:hypothetical protein
MGSLKLYPLGKIYAVFERSQDHFVIVYNDMSVGTIKFSNHRPTDGWEWSFSDSRPQCSLRRGFAPTYEDAKREVAAAFRLWLEREGEPQKYMWNHRGISELIAKAERENNPSDSTKENPPAGCRGF